MSAFLWLVISAVLIAVAVGSILSVLMCINGGNSIKESLDSLNPLSDDKDEEKEPLKEEKTNAKDGDKPADSEAAGDK